MVVSSTHSSMSPMTEQIKHSLQNVANRNNETKAALSNLRNTMKEIKQLPKQCTVATILDRNRDIADSMSIYKTIKKDLKLGDRVKIHNAYKSAKRHIWSRSKKAVHHERRHPTIPSSQARITSSPNTQQNTFDSNDSSNYK